MRLKSTKVLGAALLIAAVDGCGRSPGFAGGGEPFAGPLAAVRGLHGAATPFSLHPFGDQSESAALARFRAGQVSFPEAIQLLAGETLANGLVPSLTETPLSPQAAAGGRRFAGPFLVNAVPIFGMHMTASLLNDRSTLVLGSLPAVSAVAARTAPTSWPAADDAAAAVLAQLALPDSGARTEGDPVRYYFAASADELRPAWMVRVILGGLPYDVLTDGRSILSHQPHYLAATGTATIYNQSINDGKTVTYPLQDLTGDGTLSSPSLKTVVPQPYTQANEPSEVFNFAPSDARFAEANAYSHTDNHFRWMQSIGGQTYGDLPIDIELHQFPGGTPDNALFEPGDPSSGAPFQIIIGDGDGQILANLPTDFDVPAHESGHYFVYKYLQAVSGESLAVHEGLADLFVFLQKGVRGDANPPCLGESICPAGSLACIQPGQCLRTGDNSYAFNDANWVLWSQQLGGANCAVAGGTACGHKHGQVLSGLVWDLVKNRVLSASDAANLTMTAITYFSASSGLHDYLLALLTADKSLFSCKYDAQIRQFMGARGLLALIPDVPAGCTGDPAIQGGNSGGLVASSGTNGTPATGGSAAPGSGPAASSGSPADPAASASPAAVPSSSGKGSGGIKSGCAVISASTSGDAGNAVVLLLALLPAFFMARRRPS